MAFSICESRGKITMIKEVEKAIEMVSRQDSFDWETSARWEHEVCDSILKYPLAPRQAKAFLEIIGILADQGIRLLPLLQSIINMYPRILLK